MSTCRYAWWSYAKSIARSYPELLQQYRDLRDTRITANIEGVSGRSGRINRPTENAALRTLTPSKMRELNAAHLAVKEIIESPNGQKKMEMIKMVYWKRTHNLVGAAMMLDVSEITTKRWNGEFLRRIGKHMGFIDD